MRGPTRMELYRAALRVGNSKRPGHFNCSENETTVFERRRASKRGLLHQNLVEKMGKKGDVQHGDRWLSEACISCGSTSWAARTGWGRS